MTESKAREDIADRKRPVSREADRKARVPLHLNKLYRILIGSQDLHIGLLTIIMGALVISLKLDGKSWKETPRVHSPAKDEK